MRRLVGAAARGCLSRRRVPLTSRNLYSTAVTPTTTEVNNNTKENNNNNNNSGGATNYEFIKVSEPSTGFLYITLNRPKLHNAFNEVLIEELTRAFTISHKDNTRAIVLTGEGSSFSAGADLNWMKKMVNYSEEANKSDSLKLYKMYNTISNCPVPVVGRINGLALGGGSGLAAVCDVAVCVESAIFGFTEARLGLLPAVISPFVMQKIGVRNARRYFLTAERFDSKKAAEIGLVEERVKDVKELDELVEKILGEFKMNSPKAMRDIKKLIRVVGRRGVEGEEKSEEGVREYVCEQIAKARISSEGQEGLQAFLDRRKPSWFNF